MVSQLQQMATSTSPQISCIVRRNTKKEKICAKSLTRSFAFALTLNQCYYGEAGKRITKLIANSN
jgi:hypothetical protein